MLGSRAGSTRAAKYKKAEDLMVGEEAGGQDEVALLVHVQRVPKRPQLDEAPVHVCVHVCVRICVYVCMHVYACVYVCMCVCVYVCVGMSSTRRSTSRG